MLRLHLIIAALAVLLLFSLTLTACAVDSTGNPAGQTPPTRISNFAGMLNYVPYAFLEKQDIWFSDPGQAKKLYGIKGAGSMEEVNKLSIQELRDIGSQLSSILFRPDGDPYRDDTTITAGFDDWMADCLIFPSKLPPRTFSIKKGNFDQTLIGTKLTGQGYTKTNYAKFTCYSIRGDYEIAPDSKTLASLNRIAVLDKMIITAPSTEILTAILDSISNHQSMLNNGGVLALTASLKDILSGVIMSPDRVITQVPGQSAGSQPFNFKIPENWGILHQYDLIGTGYKESGQERIWTISLYYSDAPAATEDAATLVARLKSYILGTAMQYPEGMAPSGGVPLTAEFEVGEPRIQSYSAGSTLTIDCRYKTETLSSQQWLKHVYYFRDLLFLAPDPAPYVKAPVYTSSTPLTLEESEKQLTEQHFSPTDTVENASKLAGYPVAVPSFIPQGFASKDNNGRSGIFMLSQIGSGSNPAAVSSRDVSQYFSENSGTQTAISPFFILQQTTVETNTAGLKLTDVEIGGRPAKKSLTPGRGTNPARLQLFWSDGILNYRLEGNLASPLDEATLIKVAASMGVQK